MKFQSTTAIVDATVLYGSELWAPLAVGPTMRTEAAHMRWLRKATGEYRSVTLGRQSDAEVRITYKVASTWSLIVCLLLASYCAHAACLTKRRTLGKHI